jgi:hypothetical protein
VQAREKVDSWAWYVKVISIALIVIGIMKAFSSFIGVILGGALNEIEVEGPDGKMSSLSLPKSAMIMEKILEICTGLLILYQGKIALTAVHEKLQQQVKTLIKASGFIVLFHLLLYIFQSVFTFIIVMSLVSSWEEQNLPSGQYTFTRGED